MCELVTRQWWLFRQEQYHINLVEWRDGDGSLWGVCGEGAMYINHYYDADLCVHHDGQSAQSAIS